MIGCGANQSYPSAPFIVIIITIIIIIIIITISQTLYQMSVEKVLCYSCDKIRHFSVKSLP